MPGLDENIWPELVHCLDIAHDYTSSGLKMRCTNYAPLLITAAQAVLAAEPSRPRGVGPERTAYLPIDI